MWCPLRCFLRERVTLGFVWDRQVVRRGGLWDRDSYPFPRDTACPKPAGLPAQSQSLYSRPTKRRPPRENPTCGHPPANLNLPHRPTPPDHPIPSLRRPEPASPGSPQATPPQQHGAGDCPGRGVGRGLQGARAAKKAGGEEILTKARLRAAGWNVANTPRGWRTPPPSPSAGSPSGTGAHRSSLFRYGSSLLTPDASWDFPALGPGRRSSLLQAILSCNRRRPRRLGVGNLERPFPPAGDRIDKAPSQSATTSAALRIKVLARASAHPSRFFAPRLAQHPLHIPKPICKKQQKRKNVSLGGAGG